MTQNLRSLVFLSCAACAALSLSAQSGCWWLSTEPDVPAVAGLAQLDDGAIARLATPGAPELQWGPNAWLALAGWVPGDVDALALRPGFASSDPRALLFSLLSNEKGLLDGDLIAPKSGGGFEVVLSEASLLAALGASGANIDVDGLAYDDAGRLLWSVQADLAGTALGSVQDGDVLRLESNGSVTRLYTEAEIQAAVTAATGLTGAIGDVTALEWMGGGLVVATEGPTSADGALVRIAPQPALVFDEAAVGLAGAELDAIAWVPDASQGLRLYFDQASSPAGGGVTARLIGGMPGAAVAVFAAGAAGYLPMAGLGGFDSVYLDPADTWLASALNSGKVAVGSLDGAGQLAVGFALPPGLLGGTGHSLENGWSFQAIELGALRLSVPARVAVSGP